MRREAVGDQALQVHEQLLPPSACRLRFQVGQLEARVVGLHPVNPGHSGGVIGVSLRS
jgi:hypothetical protein